MATDFTQESLLRFIINNGGKVRNVDLLTHYRRFLRDDEDREQNRELFKRYVNSVATVKQEEGVSHVVLRKKYRVHLGDISKNQEPERMAFVLDPRTVSPIQVFALSAGPSCFSTHTLPDVQPSRLKPNRMCRSLGEDLDQPFPEDNVSARHNRLQLLSSTLSMSNLVSQSSSRGQSSQDLLSPAGSTRSLHDSSFSGKLSSIPLDPREHEWFVKAASGTWSDIYALFRDDPNLLSKRDFISGFTIVHWIAKHGDHRVLNTLWYGVDKAGMTLDVNAKTLCGYTPLHLAAIHGHKKFIRLLVQKFNADVRIRDSSGKRAWQYLSKNETWDILELLGAPQKCNSGSPANLTARPATTKVNISRHSSIAALIKHKSHLRVSSSPQAF
uniref:SOWAHA-C winged helix-turn-helix domain-containing protein n=1 Tax=Cyprinus carpio TaxID=7962 RepID=A0A8C1N1A8_CYPCA